MNQSKVGSGGFFLPDVYAHNNQTVVELLRRGEVDYADLSQWSFADEFMSFVLHLDFLEFADKTFPNPRKKNFVPVWFLIASQLVLRLHNERAYSHLKYFLNAGSILTKIGFNTSASGVVGFNEKNKYERHTAIDQDAARKFFKDTDPEEIRDWYNESFQGFLRARKVYDAKGLFVLDQSHLVVPNNANYQDAVRMPVDEHGQRYKNLDTLTDEHKRTLVYHPCYTLSCLLHIDSDAELFHFSGYDFGPGNADELAQAENLVPQFCKRNPGVMKELIVDRGYISGPWIGKTKKEHGVDVLIPLKKSMSDFQDAFAIAEQIKRWAATEIEKDATGKIVKKTITADVGEMDLWQDCPLKLNVYVSKTETWNSEQGVWDLREWALASTKPYPSEKAAVLRYALRSQVEERFKQLKCFWNISKWPSPARGLLESQICFILMTYSLMQLYLRRHDLQQLARRGIETLRQQERLGKDAVVVYAGEHFAVLCLDDYSLILVDMESVPKQKLKAIMEKQREVRLIRDSHRKIR